MAYEVKDNTFSLFVNDKGNNPNRPDYKGTGMINGKQVRVSVWKKTAKSGVEYLSGSIDEQVAVEKAPEVIDELPDDLL